jgi:hypothetical protein
MRSLCAPFQTLPVSTFIAGVAVTTATAAHDADKIMVGGYEKQIYFTGQFDMRHFSASVLKVSSVKLSGKTETTLPFFSDPSLPAEMCGTS